VILGRYKSRRGDHLPDLGLMTTLLLRFSSGFRAACFPICGVFDVPREIWATAGLGTNALFGGVISINERSSS